MSVIGDGGSLIERTGLRIYSYHGTKKCEINNAVYAFSSKGSDECADNFAVGLVLSCFLHFSFCKQPVEETTEIIQNDGGTPKHLHFVQDQAGLNKNMRDRAPDREAKHQFYTKQQESCLRKKQEREEERIERI